jgi:hypothetical protein
MDKHELKIGDKVMLLVRIVTDKVDKDGEILVSGARENDETSYASAALLHPLPAAGPLNEAERRVVEAAIAEMEAWSNYEAQGSDEAYIAWVKTKDARTAVANALIALRTPPDPVAELLKAFHEFRNGMSSGAQLRVLRAIAAIEKASEK